jgi:hypothetical protein
MMLGWALWREGQRGSRMVGFREEWRARGEWARDYTTRIELV